MSEVLETFSARLDQATVRAMSARSDLPALLRVASHYGMIVLLGFLIWRVSSSWGVAWALPLIVAQGFFVAFLFVVVHEMAHKTAFRNRFANLAVGYLSAVAIALPYEYYCLFHWEHHRHTQDPKRDPELLVAVPTSSDTWLAVAYSGLVQLGGRFRLMAKHALTGRVVVPWVPKGKRALVVREARIHLAIYAVLLIGSVAASSALLLWVWVLPLLIGQLMLRPYLYAEHVGCAETRSALENTRTTYTNAFLKWFAWNMPYHAEHHAYPSVPFHSLPALNRIIAGDIANQGQGYRAVTRETWTWFRQTR
ncbi:MAG: fatty acid desaturase [Rubritepida sp.]|nr:fatty acid desaturase [Rubritepida sp.]